MPVFSRLTSILQASNKTKYIGSRSRRNNYLVFRVALVLIFLGGVSLIVVKSGAQEMPSSIIEKKPTRYINQDIRLNNQENLSKVLQKRFVGSESSIAEILKKSQAQTANIIEGIAGLTKSNPTVEATISPLTGAIEVLRSATSLTGANPGVSGNTIVLNFIQENKQLYGFSDEDIANLTFVGESSSEVSGMRMVIVEQTVKGQFVFQSDTKFILDRDGRLIQSIGRFVPNASADAPEPVNLISPQEALQSAMASVGVKLDATNIEPINSEPNNLKTRLKVNNPAITDTVNSSIVYFPTALGILIPAWSQVIFGTDADYYTIIDATDGTLLYRKNIRAESSRQDARFRVYVQADGFTPADSPSPQSPSLALIGAGTQPDKIVPTIVSMLAAENMTASPDGWIDDCQDGGCTAAQNQTQGNNAIICLDRTGDADTNVCDTDSASVLDGMGMPMGNPDANGRNRDFLGFYPRDFQTNYLPPPQNGDPEAGQTASGNGSNGIAGVDQFRRGAITQLFYLTNFYHDKLYALGFTPAARNFQNFNFHTGGAENDRVLGDAQDVGGVNNANFSTPPDGASGRMQMYRFTGPTIDRDGELDAEIVLHELTHGLSNRLIGNGAGLNWDVGAGMGEGWSDFFALSLLNNTNADDPNGKYAMGAYATYKLNPGYVDNYVYGIRRFPYSTDNKVNPLTWADVDQITYDESGGIAPNPLNFGRNGALEVHNIGEIWANTLWEVRSRVIADPSGANGNVAAGNTKMLGIVTDALKLTPTDPSFIQARNALIDADCATNACADELSIWAGFADRGLGYNAVAPLGKIFGYAAGHMSIKESFQTPNLDVNGITIDDRTAGLGNSSGAVDAGETVKLTVNLKNPLRRASSAANGITTTLTTSTSGVSISDNSSVYPTIAPQGNASGDTFTFTVSPNMPCGASLKFKLTTNSSLGTSTKDFTIRLGSPTGVGAPVTYTSTIAGGLNIPDNTPNGVTNKLNITDDYEIADLNFRVNSLLHNSVTDITVGLKSPDGYGTDLISATGGLIDYGGVNFINTVIDQTAAAPNDLLNASASQAPYTDDYLPVFNSPGWVTAGFPTDTAGQLDRFNGLSTQGIWTVLTSDQGLVVGGGTLNSWSIIITPRAYACTAFVSAGIEGDIQSRPGGDGFVDASDIQQSRRFAIGLDMPYQSNEFQRADVAPRSSEGDGFVDADDIQQARRYAVGTDSSQIANGPSSGSTAAPSGLSNSDKLMTTTGKSFIRTKDGVLAAPAAFRVDNQNTSPGSTLVVPIRVDTVGNEAGYTFSIAFDSTILTNPQVAIGNGGGDVVFNTNNPGQIGFSVTSFSGGTIAEGNNIALVNVTFTLASGAPAGTTPITFTDTPARRKASGVDPNTPITQPTYTGGTITISGATAAGATISGRILTSGGRGIAGAVITLTEANGNRRTAISTAFGYYRFENVAAGDSYVIAATAKRWRFREATKVIALNADTGDVNFIAFSF